MKSMRKAARAIIIRDDMILVMKRNRHGNQYYSFIGGGIDPGETPEQAVKREFYEETGSTIAGAKQVFVSNEEYGPQYVFLCDDPGGPITLNLESREGEDHASGKNTYEPTWLSSQEFADCTFVFPKLQRAVTTALTVGFPEKSLNL